jgi:hypothetical protein
MLKNRSEIDLIIIEYLKNAGDFLEGKTNNYIIKNNYSISEIMFMIGVYNYTQHLDTILNFNKLLDYYKYSNIFYYAMIGAIYQDIISKNNNTDNNTDNNTENKKEEVNNNNNSISIEEKEEKEDNIINKLINYGFEYNTYRDILKVNLKTKNQELLNLIKTVYFSN